MHKSLRRRIFLAERATTLARVTRPCRDVTRKSPPFIRCHDPDEKTSGDVSREFPFCSSSVMAILQFIGIPITGINFAPGWTSIARSDQRRSEQAFLFGLDPDRARSLFFRTPIIRENRLSRSEIGVLMVIKKIVKRPMRPCGESMSKPKMF